MNEKPSEKPSIDVIGADFAAYSHGFATIAFHSDLGHVEAMASVSSLLCETMCETMVIERYSFGSEEVAEVIIIQFDNSEMAKKYIENLPKDHRILRHYKQVEE